MAGHETRNLTILLTDIKGFTDKTSRKSRGDILEMLEKHKEIVLPVLERERTRNDAAAEMRRFQGKTPSSA